MRERAVELYVRCIAVGAALPQEAYDRLRGFYGTGVPSNALRTLKQGLRGAASPPGLVVLIAHEYARQQRTDAEALDVYELARRTASDDQQVRRMCALALLARGNVAAAIVDAEAALNPWGPPTIRRSPSSSTLTERRTLSIPCP